MNYLKIYNQLVFKRQFIEPLIKTGDGTIETQHIIPKACQGPNEKWNLVNLTLREHYFAHELLVQIYKGSKFESAAIRAWNAMSRKMNGKIKTSRLYMHLRLAYNKRAGDSNRGKIVINNGHVNKYIHKTDALPDGWSYGMKPISKQALQNHRIANERRRGIPKGQINQKTNKGKITVNNGIKQKMVYPNAIPYGYVKGSLPFTDEHLNILKKARANMPDDMKKQISEKISRALKNRSSYRKGKPLSDEHKRNISNANKGKKISESAKNKIRNRQLEKIKVTSGIVTHYADKNNIPTGFKPGYITKNGNVIILAD